MAPLHDALVALGAGVEPAGPWGHLPVEILGVAGAGSELGAGAEQRSISMPGDISSQYITALMLISPYIAGGLRIMLSTPLVSRPYLAITASVMADFGVSDVEFDGSVITIGPGTYAARDYSIEPDASSASYPLAAAAICGGSVHVVGLGPDSLQGDSGFADVLASMGCTVIRNAEGTTVQRNGTLKGVAIDMADLSDLVPTLAVVAPFASTATEITGVGFIRAKESDRLGDLARELGKCGIDAIELDDGIRIEPGVGHGTELDTHHDHRLAMAFGVLGMGLGGVGVRDPDVVSKSWPGFWGMLESLLAEPVEFAGADRPVVAAFDVDGTLTTHDSMVPFLEKLAGRARLLAGLVRQPVAVASAAVHFDRDRFKEVVVRTAYRGRDVASVEQLGAAYAVSINDTLLRPDTYKRLAWHQRQGHRVVLVSASLGAYLHPLGARLGVDAVLCTEAAVGDDGRYTGELIGENCRGPEKERRLRTWLLDNNLEHAELWAYGDSRGDRELLLAAHHRVNVKDRQVAETPEPGS